MEVISLLLERGADREAGDDVSYADREIHLPHIQHIASHPILSHTYTPLPCPLSIVHNYLPKQHFKCLFDPISSPMKMLEMLI